MSIYKKVIVTDENGDNVIADSVVLGSSDGSYGIKETTSGTVIIANNTSVTNTSIGVYEYDVSALTSGTSYTISWKIVYLGATQYVTEVFTHSSAVSTGAMTIAQSKQVMLDLIIESVVNGVAVNASKNQDYLLLHNVLADIAQKEIAAVKKIHAVRSITQNPITNQLGEYKGFDLQQHLNTDLTDTQATGSKSYYFEVDDPATIYIEEETAPDTWTTLSTITHIKKGSFTAYKGLITASSTANDIRIRFSGSYPYNIRNTALFGYTFGNVNDVPNYTPYVSYTLPSNFRTLNKISYRGDNFAIDNYRDYRWEGKKTLLIDYYMKGSFDVYYYANPTTITSSTSDTHEFEVDIEAQPLIPMYVASKVVAEEKPTMAAILFNEYRLKLSELTDDNVMGDDEIYSVDGW